MKTALKKVRYLTVSRMAVEIVSKLTEQEKALFLDIIFSAFKQIENGEPVTIPEIDGVLKVAIDETIAELEIGFKNYRQKMTAVEMALEKKRQKELKEMGVDPSEIADTTPTKQRPIADTTPTDIISDVISLNESDNTNGSIGEGMQGGNRISDEEMRNLQVYQLQAWLNRLQIPVDDDILNAWKKYGFDAVRSAVDRFKNVKPPVKKSVFIDLVREEGNRV